MKLLIVKDIEHYPGFWLRAGQECNVWDSIARKYVKAGLAIDVNHVMNEPSAAAPPTVESMDIEPKKETTAIAEKKKSNSKKSK